MSFVIFWVYKFIIFWYLLYINKVDDNLMWGTTLHFFLKRWYKLIECIQNVNCLAVIFDAVNLSAVMLSAVILSFLTKTVKKWRTDQTSRLTREIYYFKLGIGLPFFNKSPTEHNWVRVDMEDILCFLRNSIHHRDSELNHLSRNSLQFSEIANHEQILLWYQ